MCSKEPGDLGGQRQGKETVKYSSAMVLRFGGASDSMKWLPNADFAEFTLRYSDSEK